MQSGVFVRNVIDALGLQDNARQKARKPEYRGAGALATLLEVDRVTVTRWLDGERSPEYVPTMQMLQLCRWLNMGEAARPTVETEEQEADPQEELLGAVVATAELLERLEAIAHRLPKEAPPREAGASGTPRTRKPR